MRAKTSADLDETVAVSVDISALLIVCGEGRGVIRCEKVCVCCIYV